MTNRSRDYVNELEQLTQVMELAIAEVEEVQNRLIIARSRLAKVQDQYRETFDRLKRVLSND